MSSERSPLLASEKYSQSGGDDGSWREPGGNGSTQGGTFVTVPPIGPNELPPPYSSLQSGGLMISCKVCNSMIDITGKKDQHVVKCSNCNEATPIKNAPVGKKYVRCPCNCLLICKSNSERIACPRPHCKRIINLSPSPLMPDTPTIPGMCQVSCAHCRDLFLFNTLNNALARCPHCRKVSSIGHYARRQGYMCLFISLFMLLLTIIVPVWTFQFARSHAGMYVLYSVLPVITILLFGRGCKYLFMRVSVIEGPV